jgi:hypothetical protein
MVSCCAWLGLFKVWGCSRRGDLVVGKPVHVCSQRLPVCCLGCEVCLMVLGWGFVGTQVTACTGKLDVTIMLALLGLDRGGRCFRVLALRVTGWLSIPALQASKTATECVSLRIPNSLTWLLTVSPIADDAAYVLVWSCDLDDSPVIGGCAMLQHHLTVLKGRALWIGVTWQFVGHTDPLASLRHEVCVAHPPLPPSPCLVAAIVATLPSEGQQQVTLLLL